MTQQSRVVAIFGSSQTDPASPDWSDAVRVGARCATAGLTVITGGYGGTMEAASQGAHQAGGHVIGVTAPTLFPDRHGANPYVSEQIEATSLVERVAFFFQLATGAIVLPGSIGTATELVVAWNINFIAARAGAPRFPTVAVGEAWKRLFQLFTTRLGTPPGDIHVTNGTDRAVDWLLSQPEIR